MLSKVKKVQRGKGAATEPKEKQARKCASKITKIKHHTSDGIDSEQANENTFG